MNWNDIDTVLLDMDGTLLDLYFDNFFWQEHLPAVVAEQRKLSMEKAKALLEEEYATVRGQLAWYCLDYWTEKLNLDIPALKETVADRIRIRKDALTFLEFLQKHDKRVLLVTNAHPTTLEIKLLRIELKPYFERLISSHRYGYPKERIEFWQALHEATEFDPARTVFIDDSVPILRTAAEFGIAYPIAVSHPDTSREPIGTDEFENIDHFRDILPKQYQTA